jgi:hypothetical protein
MTRRCQRCARARFKLLSFFVVLLVANIAFRHQASLPIKSTQEIVLIPGLVTALYAILTALRMRKNEG